jgi:hypothetical protein
MQETNVFEIRLLAEADLQAFAADTVDAQTKEAIEAYLLHHPEACRRVEAYRHAAERPQRKHMH